MAKTKQGGSSRLGRDSESKRLGVKIYDGQKISTGMIIIRQRGTKYLPGKNTKRGSDDTIYAVKKGVVRFKPKTKMLYSGKRRTTTIISVDEK